MLMIENVDQRSKDYTEIRDKFRPGHADLTYQAKYGLRDYRGGGRSSARETAARVAAGAVARKVIPGVTIRAALVQMGALKIDYKNWDWAEVQNNPFFSPDAKAAAQWEEYLDGVRKAGSSCGAVVEVTASGVPAGWGAPIYGKLDQDLAAAMMSINAVKGVEIGAGFAAAAFSGEQNADEIRMRHGKPEFLSNHAGGILRHFQRPGHCVRMAVEAHLIHSHLAADDHGAGHEYGYLDQGRHDPASDPRRAGGGSNDGAGAGGSLLRHRAQMG